MKKTPQVMGKVAKAATKALGSASLPAVKRLAPFSKSAKVPKGVKMAPKGYKPKLTP